MVSVVIPVYNGAAFLEQSLRSVLAQSYTELQVIVIDDGSKDASYEICEKIAQKDSRVCLVRQKNAGICFLVARIVFLCFWGNGRHESNASNAKQTHHTAFIKG